MTYKTGGWLKRDQNKKRRILFVSGSNKFTGMSKGCSETKDAKCPLILIILPSKSKEWVPVGV